MILLFIFLFIVSCHTSSSSLYPPGVIVFLNETSGYHTFRIPTVARTSVGTLIVFAEGRARYNLTTKDDADCYGEGASAADWKCTNKDLVLRRSLDQGNSWSDLTVLALANTSVFYTNPQPLATSNGLVFVLYMRCVTPVNGGNAFVNCTACVQKSDDDGVTWSNTIEISPVQSSSGGFGGLELAESGRLIFSPPGSSSTGALISDTGGDSWRWGQPAIKGGGENQIVQLSNKTLLMTVRKANNTRMLFTSVDEGESWDSGKHQNVTDPNCQASMISVGTTSMKNERTEKGRIGNKVPSSSSSSFLLFSNPHTSGLLPYAEGRQNVTVQRSNDASIWTPILLVDQGPSAYTALVQLNETHCGILYEESNNLPVDFRSIRFLSFDCSSG